LILKAQVKKENNDTDDSGIIVINDDDVNEDVEHFEEDEDNPNNEEFILKQQNEINQANSKHLLNVFTVENIKILYKLYHTNIKIINKYRRFLVKKTTTQEEIAKSLDMDHRKLGEWVNLEFPIDLIVLTIIMMSIED
jgi:hypothetical protein